MMPLCYLISVDRSEKVAAEIKADLDVVLEIVGNRKVARIWWPEGKPLPTWFIDQSKQSESQVQSLRWVVERTFGWFGRYRRLSKDYERKTPNSEGMIWVAMTSNLINRLASST